MDDLTIHVRPRRMRAFLMVAALMAPAAATIAGFAPAAGATPNRPTSPAGASATAQAAPPETAADVGDLGWEGPSFSGSSGSPSGSKPESKLWFNDGRWWASLWEADTDDFFIHWLDVANQTWVKTTTRLDTRSNARSDTLWDGSKLYVASHVFSESAASGYPSWLQRFSYSSATKSYTLDAGFPVQINNVRTETLVIDKDSTGTLWATWTQSKQVYLSSSPPGGGSWSTPVPLAVAGINLTTDDISSVVAFGSSRIGIMWSDQIAEKMFFSVHRDSDPPNVWSTPEVAYSGTKAADDHINLKSVADQGGRILAAVKTSRTGAATLNHLLDRDPVTGVWTSHEFGKGSDNHTRPIVVVDTDAQVVHMFAPSRQSGGTIYEKTSPLTPISFPPGLGTPVLTDASSADINNPASTKQNVNNNTGLVVLATNDTTRQYWTHYDDLGGSTPLPPAPIAHAGPDQTVTIGSGVTLDASTSTGPAPLDVTWTQIGGPTVALSDPKALRPTFQAPANETTLTFRVTVTDVHDRTSTDTIIVSVRPK